GGYGASRLVATKPAPARTVADARSSSSKSKPRWSPTTTADAGGRVTGRSPAASSASTTPGPAHASTGAPGSRADASRVAADTALVITSSVETGAPAAPSLAPPPPTRRLPLFHPHPPPNP